MENAQKRYTASSAPLKKSNDYLESKVEIFFFFSFLSKNSCKRYIITADCLSIFSSISNAFGNTSASKLNGYEIIVAIIKNRIMLPTDV